MSEWPGVDLMPWVTAEAFDPELLGPGVSYLRAETMDGRALMVAPLGSPKPWPTGEGVWWKIRQTST